MNEILERVRVDDDQVRELSALKRSALRSEAESARPETRNVERNVIAEIDETAIRHDVAHRRALAAELDVERIDEHVVGPAVAAHVGDLRGCDVFLHRCELLARGAPAGAHLDDEA